MGNSFVECCVCGREFLVDTSICQYFDDEWEELTLWVCDRCEAPVGGEIHWVAPDYNENRDQLKLTLFREVTRG